MTPPPPFPAPHLDPSVAPLSRRSVLRGAAALGVAGAMGGLGLAACGGDDTSTDPGAATTGEGGLVLVSMIDAASSLAAGSESRLPLGLGDARGTLVKEAPATLTFDVQDAEDDTVVASGIEVARHDAGLPRAYYPVMVTVAEPGFYRAVTTVGGAPIDAAFEVSSVDQITIPQPGQAFPSLTTPTTTDAAGVDPICTQDPPCPLHETDLASALGQGPVALLVSTPAFCQTAICGPVLDLFVDAAPEFPEVTFIHVEVYASAEEVEANGLQAPLAPTVEALELPFEPSLFLVGADGTLAQRVDVIYDEVELRDALGGLIA